MVFIEIKEGYTYFGLRKEIGQFVKLSICRTGAITFDVLCVLK